jgi:XTP/dITP diphosphohydrolase
VRVVVATQNPGKLLEIREILAQRDVELCDLSGLAAVEFPEEGGEYRPNALGKARAVAEQLGERALADDSGLEVEALGGAPGPYSARFGGAGLDDQGRVQHLLRELAAVPGAVRRARFVCWTALAEPSGEVRAAFGTCPGTILAEPCGTGGFGYDPIFRPDGYTKSMAELAAASKHELSHRARALRALFAGSACRWAPGAQTSSSLPRSFT